MKKLLLIPIIIGTGACIVIAQSGRLSLSKKAYPIQKNLLSNDALFTVSPSQAQGSTFKKNPSAMGGFKVVGFSCYDLQTNASVGKRIINHADGTLSFVWTVDDDCSASYANRGSGYNYWNGTSFLLPPVNTRIETVRTGFSHIALLGNGSEVIMAHKGPPYDFIMSTNGTKGTGTWTGVAAGATLILPVGGVNQGLWNKMATGGSDGNSIHLLAGYFEGGQMGVTTPFTYSRSTDAGQSWDIQSMSMPGYDSTRSLNGSAENYVIDAVGTTVAVVEGRIDGDVALWKSTDNGTTFLRTFVDSFKYAPTIDSCACPDTAITCDGGMDVVVDPNGKVHVAYSTVRVLTGGYFPQDYGLVYWNDVAKTQVNIPILDAVIDANINGGNGTSAYEVGGATWLINNPASASPPNARYGNKALLSIPSIAVDGNNVFIIFSLVTDGDSTSDGRSFRDIWVVASSDGGVTFGAIQNVTCTPQEEEYFGSLAKRVDNNLHILYQWDLDPGTSLQNGHAINSAEIHWAVIDKAAVLAGTAHCSASGLGVPDQITPAFNISESYPNPTNGITYFDVTMKQNATVSLEIFNNLGQQVYSAENKLAVGKHTLSVDAGSFSSGLYFYTIKSGNSSVASGKITVVE